MNEIISKDRMQDIENKVSEILNNADLSVETQYIDITALIKKDGFEIRTKEMNIDTTGYLLVNDDEDEKLIVVNTEFKNPDNEIDVIFKKSRFIAAHEYGHYILHKKENEPIYAHRDTDHRTELIEQEADYFARSILMPLDTFKMCYDVVKEINGDNYSDNIFILSNYFKVTRNKIKKRIDDLNILN